MNEEPIKKRPAKNSHAKSVSQSVVPSQNPYAKTLVSTHKTLIIHNNINININQVALPGTPNLTQDSQPSKTDGEFVSDLLRQDLDNFPAFN